MSWLLVVADARRARVFEVEQPGEDEPRPRFGLTELDDLTEPDDDNRERHREEIQLRFARRVSSDVLQRVSERAARRLMIVAPARTLGHLRQELVSRLPSNVSVDELGEDLSWHPTARLRDELTQRGLLPRPRGV